MYANINDFLCWFCDFQLLQHILSGFQDVVVELKLFSQLRKVFFEEEEGIGALSNVKELIETEIFRIPVEPFVREISIKVFLKQRFPGSSLVLL